MLCQRLVGGEHVLRVAVGVQRDQADFRLVEAQAQQRVVQLAERAQGPQVAALGNHAVRVRRRRLGWRCDRERRRARVAIELDGDVLVFALDRHELHRRTARNVFDLFG